MSLVLSLSCTDRGPEGAFLWDPFVGRKHSDNTSMVPAVGRTLAQIVRLKPNPQRRTPGHHRDCRLKSSD
ncbi:MAG: hypothetical protein ACI9W6_000783 [Motiliproteus sp.]|jgi:hypothetical protein